MSKVKVGVNDFETWCIQNHKEDILSEWDYKTNFPLTPKNVAYGSSKKIAWIGKCGHSYVASLNKRTSDGTGCPYCCESHAKLLKGFNDLATTNPELLEFWDYDKNKDINPTMVMKGQHIKVWWKGNCGHSWQSTIYHRVNGRGCPICNKESKTSFPEQAVFYYLKKVFCDIELGNRDILDGKELDIFIPSERIAIEFDGAKWHSDVEKDNYKNELCFKKQITLFRIRDVDAPILDENKNVIIINHYNYSDECLRDCVLILSKYLNCDINIDLARDRNQIYEQYLVHKKENSLLKLYPDIATEWDYSKNGTLTPEMVTGSSDKKVWWIGECGHSWQTVIHARTKSLSGCPYCNSNRVLRGFNDLATTNPELLKSWDYELNSFKPTEITNRSRKIAWWHCPKCDISYQQAIYLRAESKECSVCSKNEFKLKIVSSFITNQDKKYQRKIIGKTIDITDPEILSEWDYDNNTIKPSEITKGQAIKVWWKCSKGHSYQMTISNKVELKRGCPICSNRQVLAGYNDAATTNPEILDFWDYEKNTISPSEITRYSKVKVWWKCSNGHSRQAYIYSYIPNSCPICSGNSKKKVINIDTGEVFNSLSDAAKSCNLKSGDTISLCCKGKQLMAGGYHWKYSTESD